MSGTVDPVNILDSLPASIGETPWASADEVGIGMRIYANVRHMVDRARRRIHPQDYRDLQRFSFDGLLWNLSRARGVLLHKPADSKRMWAAAFLLGALGRACLAKRKDVGRQIGRALCELGCRVEAESIWRGFSPRNTRGTDGQV